MTAIEAVYEAYSNRDDAALVTALKALLHELSRDGRNFGPAVVALRLREYPDLAGVIGKVGSDASQTPVGELGYLAGFINAYISHIKLMADRTAVDAAEAKLLADRGVPGPATLIRTMILKTAFAYSGSREVDLLSGVACAAGVSVETVKHHTLKLVELKALEDPKFATEDVMYRTSLLGGALLERWMNPHKLALFFVDEAAHDEKLRAAMQDEIRRTWPK